MSNAMIQCEQLTKIYHDGTAVVPVLHSIDFIIEPADRIAIVGPSGSGKSTFLHLLGGLDKPSDGRVFINQIDWQSVSEKKRCQLRNQQLGFIYQFHHLLPEFSALENVAMPLLLSHVTVKEAEARAGDLLQQIGLAHRMQHKPAQLSGGERQRVAIARALVHRPQCVFADEPTGNLDQTTASHVFDVMLALNASQQTALVIVTHDMQLAQKMNKILHLREGRLMAPGL